MKQHRKLTGRILDKGANWVFQIDDMESKSQFRSNMDQGVDFISFGQFSQLGAIVFSKREFKEFKQVRQWLLNFGFRPTNEQPAELAQLELESNSRIYVPTIQMGPLTVGAFKGQEKTWLVMEAKPLTPGTHKKFEFTSEVIRKAAPLYEGANMVLHHKFEEPADVVGRILTVEETGNEDAPVEVTAVIFNDDTAKQVRNGELHSVSSNIILIANEETMTVEEILEVKELTLTPSPADPDSVITAFKDVEFKFSTELTKFEREYLSEHPDDCPSGQHRVDGECVPLEAEENEEGTLTIDRWMLPASGFKESLSQPPSKEANLSVGGVTLETTENKPTSVEMEDMKAKFVALEGKLSEFATELQKTRTELNTSTELNQKLLDDQNTQRETLKKDRVIRAVDVLEKSGRIATPVRPEFEAFLLELEPLEENKLLDMLTRNDPSAIPQAQVVEADKGLDIGLVPNTKDQAVFDLSQLTAGQIEELAINELTHGAGLAGGLGVRAQVEAEGGTYRGAFPLKPAYAPGGGN